MEKSKFSNLAVDINFSLKFPPFFHVSMPTKLSVVALTFEVSSNFIACRKKIIFPFEKKLKLNKYIKLLIILIKFIFNKN
jgi:hypothetical protein